MIIKLSDRLQMIADEIKKGETMADIGTDHGFLPLYLWQNEISPEVVMCDISIPSLQKAIDAKTQLLEDGEKLPQLSGDSIKYRAGDGLQVLSDGEVDAVVIAGMGGVLMTEIMGVNMKKTLSFKKFILQPRNHSGALRYWLTVNGFNIVSNKLVREGKFICEIITAIPPESEKTVKVWHAEDDAYWDMPKEMKDDELLEAFAKLKLRREMKVLAGMQRGSDVPVCEMEKIQKRAQYFAQFIK